MVATRRARRRRAVFLPAFAVFYVAGTMLAHVAAPSFGRVPLPCRPGNSGYTQSILYCALNRNYASPRAAALFAALAQHMEGAFPGTKTLALDANFPFLKGFPLLPHLSHDDGEKIDIALYYTDDQGNYLPGDTRSPVGYFAFEQPMTGATNPCGERSRIATLRWDMSWLQRFFPQYRLDQARTREALVWLDQAGPALGLEKIFVEPHLAARLVVHGSAVRFQGCRAARHDDHIHFQTKADEKMGGGQEAEMTK